MVTPAIRLKDKDQTIGGLTCQHCGVTNPDVEPTKVYVGGQGYVERNYCQDFYPCWARFDNAN